MTKKRKDPFQVALETIRELKKENDILNNKIDSLEEKISGDAYKFETVINSDYSIEARLENIIKESGEAMKRNIEKINKEAQRYAKQIKN